MKKFIVIFLAAVLAVLSGCRLGSDPGGSDDPIIKPDDPREFETKLVISGNDRIRDDDSANVLVKLTRTDKQTGKVEAIANAEITLSVDGNGGKLKAEKIRTSDYGEATTKFSADLGTRESVTYKITARYSIYSDEFSVLVSRNAEDIISGLLNFDSDGSYRLDADGVSSLGLTATLKDDNGVLIPGQKINFKTTANDGTAEGGALTVGSATTNDKGQAKTEIISARRNALVTVTASLDSDPSVNKTCVIEFNGMSIFLNNNENKSSIRPDGTDTIMFTATLLDAAKREVYNAAVDFVSLSPNNLIIGTKSTSTDSRGEAWVKLTAKNVVDKTLDTLVAFGAGVRCSIEVNYSSRNIKIDTAGFNNSYAVNPKSEKDKETQKYYTEALITFLEPDNATRIPDADISISVSAGGIVQGGSVLSNITRKTDAQGQFGVKILNPEFSGNFQINVKAKKGKEITDTTCIIPIKAGELYRLKLEASPDVITVGSDKARLTVTAYDSSGNLVNDGEKITFSLVGGTGGAGRLESFSAATKDGQASVNLSSEAIESDLEGLRIVACSENCVKMSDTVTVTVINAVKNVRLTNDIGRGITANLGTYRFPLEVLATTVNGYAVPETPVTFGVRIVGWTILKRVATLANNGKTIIYGAQGVTLSFNDYNFNYIHDFGEGGGGYPLYRGEQVAQFPLDTSFNYGPKFADINGNGVRDYITSDGKISNEGYEPPEPWWLEDDIVKDSITLTGGIGGEERPTFQYTTYDGPIHRLLPSQGRSICYVDYNRSSIVQKFDVCEPLLIPGTFYIDENSNDDSELIKYYNAAPYNGNYKDIDWNSNGKREPEEGLNAVSVGSTKTTKDGLASTDLIYAKNQAWVLGVEVWAEVKGIRSNVIRFNPLPILDGDKSDIEKLIFSGKENLWR